MALQRSAYAAFYGAPRASNSGARQNRGLNRAAGKAEVGHVLAPPERRELKRRARKRSLAVELVKRTEVILMLAAGHSYREVRQRLGCSDEYIREWKS